jgi:hypothetical protein
MAKAARLGFTTLLSATRARANQRKTFDGLRVEFLHSPPALGCNKVIGARTNTSTLNDLSWRRKYHVQHSVNKTSLNRFNSP